MNKVGAFHLSLDDDPRDWDTRLVMADYYEDQGHSLVAEAIRWQVQYGYRPDRRSSGQWSWFVEGRLVGTLTRHHTILPADLFQRFCPRMTEKAGQVTLHPTRRHAEEALWMAWIQYKECRLVALL